jgi:asparagine synthase (glutamine-hydrolysing)
VCGICGSTASDARSRVEAMNRRMVHRGPDDEGVFADEGVALGARRLSVIDVAGGHQPVANEDRSVWAVLNGELYNHPELQERLRGSGHELRSRTDTEVLVHLYEELGPDLVHALDGMYAFAIWDARERRLTIARDRFGEKPLFYRCGADGNLEFASELTTLARDMATAELDPAALDAFFVLGYVPGEQTILRDVRQLPPGHLLTWTAAERSLSLSRYWRMPARPPEPDREVGELLDETEYLMRAAVRSRLISDVPLGVFLSGGVDSALVTALACQESGHQVETFTVGYDVGAVNENDAARAVALALDTDHHELVLREADIAQRVPALLRRLDQPHADPALVALHGVAELARERVTVAVGGEGADELFGGYPRYRWLTRADRIDRNVPAVLAGAAARVIEWRAEGPTRARRVADVLAPGDLVDRHIGWVTARREESRSALYGERMRPLAASTAVADDARTIVEDEGDVDVAAAFMALDQQRFLPDDVLAKADRASMLVSLEVRTPFLERRLAEFSASVPASVHLRGGGKHLLRRLLDRVAPEVAERPKTAFRVPLAEWLRGPLAGELRAQAGGGRLVSEGWFDGAALSRLADEHMAGHDRSALLWPAFVFGVWLDAARAG